MIVTRTLWIQVIQYLGISKFTEKLTKNLNKSYINFPLKLGKFSYLYIQP